ncbi:SAM-dependent methyltransferase [Lentzea tibetensis]|uniref:SAM-dependent methyltransferase n=1 Tax=Lentzea tibetensis TaxID=2591470 RepID=A0A563ESN5_9PSEU|nr:methyltransferase [Lentzea tibetensis]TWP50548.1 SAM-dependent methyltransferase [Lentzea tibetensis]
MTTEVRPGLLVEYALSYLYSSALNTAARLGVADHLHDGPRTAAELAAATGAHGPNLHRVLRFLATRGVFREDDESRFHLTPLAEPLRADSPKSLRDFVLSLGDGIFLEPAARMYDTVVSGRAVFDDIFDAPFYEHLANDPVTGPAYNAGMAAFSNLVSNDVTAAYDFPDHAVVVDVGGGRGGLLRSILLQHPHVTGVLFDLPSVVDDHVLDEPDLAGRWRVESGDFFESVPEGGDVYVFKHVFASWSDADCLRLLSTCRKTMPDNGRVLVVNGVIPPGNDPHPGKTIDVLILNLLGGKERTLPEYESLLVEAGFTVSRVIPVSPNATIIEGTPA